MAETQDKTATASIKNLNITPRKVRLVVDLIKGQPVASAIALLQAIPNRSSGPIEKLVHSAVTNAQAKHMDITKLVIANLTVDKGRVLRRMKAKAKGMAGLLQHIQSHVYLTIKESPDLKGPAYVLPQKVKKVKKEVKQKKGGKEKPQFKETEKPKPEKKAGFVKKFFQRKSI